jgi:hypothetical protein
MLKKTWRRSSSPAVWAVALVVGAPALVQAQTQLFPLAPITRDRVPCPMEDPVYGSYRHQYFGYFPTCWRPFAPGWGCPSPEAPNGAAEFKARPRDPLPDNLMEPEEGRRPAGMPGEEPAVPRDNRNLPPLPPAERSPFDLDPDAPPNTPGGRIPEPTQPGGMAPRQERAAPRGASRMVPQPAAPGGHPTVGEAAAPLLALPDPAESTANDQPAVSGPELQARPVVTPESPSASSDGFAPRPPYVNPTTGRPVVSPSLPPSSPANVLAPTAVAPVAMPVQAPQRRGPLSTLFSGLTSKLRR